MVSLPRFARESVSAPLALRHLPKTHLQNQEWKSGSCGLTLTAILNNIVRKLKAWTMILVGIISIDFVPNLHLVLLKCMNFTFTTSARSETVEYNQWVLKGSHLLKFSS